MARKEFTEEELAILRNNPYVKNVTQCKIRFTVAFKKRFWEEYQRSRPIAAIVADMGIDPEILGGNRLYGMASAFSMISEMFSIAGPSLKNAFDVVTA